MRKDVKITVESKIGAGRATVVAAIAQALKERGYNVEQATPDGVPAARSQEISLKHAEETIITIVDRQLPRVP